MAAETTRPIPARKVEYYKMKKFAEDALNYVNTYSKPSKLKITDMRFAHVKSSSVHCILLF